MQPVESLVATDIGGTSGRLSENGSVRMVWSAVMTRVGRRRKWCMISVGVSVGENLTRSARDSGRSTQADGHWNAMSE
ncbi:hypothetical protein MTO96_040899 [Rhipicephalus appendiculatus]